VLVAGCRVRMMNGMWQEYKKRFWISQAVILLGTLVAWQVGKLPPAQLVMVFFAMQVGALLGAGMGARMKRQIERAERDDDLPLKPR